MVVSRNRSCFNARARFFLYFAKLSSFARTHGDARSKLCMIAETANLAAAFDDVKDASVATNNVSPLILTDEALAGFLKMTMREQIFRQGCLTTRRPEKHWRSSGLGLLAHRCPKGGAE